ncbi:MAG: hypothetical protein IJ307_05380 [Bacteroidales bacterium]|nr:hypothetical protein [Bacteroidales bacterium]
MMRRVLYILALAMALTACSQDEGNYDYVDLKEPVITGLHDQSVLTLSRLQLTPDLGEADFPEGEYAFEWKVLDRNAMDEAVVIGTERNLDYEVTLAPGSYALYFTVTDVATGLYWQQSVELTVSSSMSEGWMVLCSDGGRARLDVVSAVTGETMTDVLKGTGMPQMNGPRKIQWLSDKTDAASPYYLLTGDGATRLGKDAFEWKPEYDFSYEVAVQDKLVPHSIVSAGFGKVVVSGTSAHYCEIMGIDGLYGSAVNKDFAVAPFVGANVLATQVYAAVYMLYDIDGRRLVAYCPLLAANDLGGLDPLTSMDEMGQIAEGMAPGSGVLGNAFDAWPEGYDCVYMENTRYDPGNAKMGLTYVLLKDGEDCHLYGVQLGDMLRYADCTYVLGKRSYADLSQCQDILHEDALYAFSSLKNYMYYAVRDKVYRVDLSSSSPEAELQFSLPGERVTCLKFNLYQKHENAQKSYDLLVGSHKDGTGVLRVYEGRESDGDLRNVEPEVYEGFAEIVDVTYKERIY